MTLLSTSEACNARARCSMKCTASMRPADQPLAEERATERKQLYALEDEAIRRVVTKQEELGLPVVTDGGSPAHVLQLVLDAVEDPAEQTKLQFRDDDGSVVAHEGSAAIVERLRKIDSPGARRPHRCPG